MLPTNGLLEISVLLTGVGAELTTGAGRSIIATGPAVASGLGAVSIFGPVFDEPAPQLPVDGPNGEIDGAAGAGLGAGAAGRADVAAARGAEVDALLRPPAPLAAPLNNSSSGNRRCA